jgi:HEAT repeat protein
MNIQEEIKNHLIDLEDNDIQVRNTARWLLTDMGSKAVPDLIQQLKMDKEHCRWEAAKILGEIRDPSAANALVNAMIDESINVRWAASTALIKYGRKAILPLLEGITRHFDSMRFRQGAYHVLHELERFHQLDPRAQEVLDALRDIEPSVNAPWAAERAIEYYKFREQ